MKIVKKALAFLRLLDENGHLSITNLFAIVTLYKYAILDGVTVMEMVALLPIIGAYQFKRYTQRCNKSHDV